MYYVVLLLVTVYHQSLAICCLAVVPSNFRSIECSFHRVSIPSSVRSIECSFHRMFVPSSVDSIECSFHRTSVPSNVPRMFPSSVRCVRMELEFPMPSQGLRESLWTTLVPKATPLSDDVDFSKLAVQYDFTGGRYPATCAWARTRARAHTDMHMYACTSARACAHSRTRMHGERGSMKNVVLRAATRAALREMCPLESMHAHAHGGMWILSMYLRSALVELTTACCITRTLWRSAWQRSQKLRPQTQEECSSDEIRSPVSWSCQIPGVLHLAWGYESSHHSLPRQLQQNPNSNPHL